MKAFAMKDTLDAEGAPAPASIAPRIKVSNLNHDYVSDRTGLSNPVLRDIDLSIAPGDFVSIVGPSGCGKSTLLTLMAGLSRPSSGVIEVDSLPVTGVSTAVQNPATRRRKTRPGGGGLRHGARAYHRAGACHGALAPWGQIEAI